MLGVNYEFQFAQKEFFGLDGEPRAARAFPLRGKLTSSDLRIGARAGLLDELELEFSVPLRIVSYQSDSVILLEQPATSSLSSLDYFQENVIELARDKVGIGDLMLATRYQWLPWPVALATEIRAKIPTGYQGPSGTFGSQPESAEAFLENVATFVSPENVTDDVTLGDGQVDLTWIQHAGMGFSSGTFFRAEVGYNLRLGGAADQVQAGLRFGQQIKRVLLYAGSSLAYSVQTGRIIGVSVAAIDPELPADQYGGTTNLLLREVRLRSDALNVGGGLIIPVVDGVELNLAYRRTVWGRNTAVINAVGIGVIMQTSLIPEPPSPSEQAKAEYERHGLR